MGVIEALMVVGGIAQDEVPDLLIFHALQTDIDAQPSGEADGGLHHHLGVLVLQNVEDKALVDLQPVHRQVADQIHGGQAGAEVVQRHPDAPGAEELKLRAQIFHVHGAAPLCQLQAEVLGRVPCFPQNIHQAVPEPPAFDLGVSDIDVQEEMGVFIHDRPGLCQRLPEDPVAQREEAVVLFQNGDEAAGRDFAEDGALPTEEGLRALGTAIRRPYQRLIDHVEAVAAVDDVLPQCVQQFHGAVCVTAQLVVEKYQLAVAFPLGHFQRIGGAGNDRELTACEFFHEDGTAGNAEGNRGPLHRQGFAGQPA